MVSLLAKTLIKNGDDFSNPAVRRAYGALCSVVGILLNFIAFAGKYIAGTLSNSISITADAFNNLTDAASSVITFVGFRLSGKKPDPDHPFGHGRIEYLSGLAVSIMIFVMGFELFQSSIDKIRNPEPVEPSILVGIIMVVSILIKFYMAYYNSKIGKKIDSAAMMSVATDSISDTISTFVVLLSMVFYYFTDINIDPYAGLLVSCLILYAGCNSAKETISPLLGKAPDPNFVLAVEEIVRQQCHIVGIHDLIVHDYGPGRVFVSLHAEVPGNEDIYMLHDEIDNAERTLEELLHCHAVIHMDPVSTDDDELNAIKQVVTNLIEGLDPAFSIHDFRMVPGTTHNNLIFDLVVPSNYKMTYEEVNALAKEKIENECEGCFAVITVEQSYV